MQTDPVFIKSNDVAWTLSSGNSFDFTVARLDEIHPFISGNKYFKLKYNLQSALAQNKQGIITMGGAFSNHLSATAFACHEAGLESAGIIRGEIIQSLNPTLSFCEQMQMQLIPVERKDYNRNSETVEEIQRNNNHLFFVPEGGYNAEGLQGCKEILSMIPNADSFTHILCCMGTGTTFKGIAASAKIHQTVIGIPVLKIRADERELFIQQHASIESAAKKQVLFDYAGDGYAKLSEGQINFMNSFYTKTGIPTDIVYTAKLMQAVITLAEQDYFTRNNKILVLHTGGLQGNSSLKPGTLFY